MTTRQVRAARRWTAHRRDGTRPARDGRSAIAPGSVPSSRRPGSVAFAAGLACIVASVVLLVGGAAAAALRAPRTALVGDPACRGSQLCITSPSPGPVLTPGVTTPGNLTLTVTNPVDVTMNVYSLTVSFTNTFSNGCSYRALSVNGDPAVALTSPVDGPGVALTLDPQLAVPAATGSGPGAATETLTLAMSSRGDACADLALDMTYSALANYTDITSTTLAVAATGTSATLTATVTAGNPGIDTGAVSGAVNFYGCTSPSLCSPSASGLLGSASVDANGKATYVDSADALPAYVEAVYTGYTTDFDASTSSVVTVGDGATSTRAVGGDSATQAQSARSGSPIAPTVVSGERTTPVLAATSVHTGEWWAGAQPLLFGLGAAGFALVGLGWYQRRRRDEEVVT